MREQGKHAGLQRDQVLATAVDLIDSDGLQGLSMRRLAGELGVEAMTLYHHFQNKGALEDAIVEHVLAGSRAPSGNRRSWQTELKRYATGLHNALADHPGIAQLIATRPATTTRNLQDLEALLEIMTGAGFHESTALGAVQTAAATILGLHLSHPGSSSDAASLESASILSSALAHADGSVGTQVEFALTALIAGFEAQLRDSA